MSLPLSGWVFYDDGTSVDGAVVEVYDQTPTLIATDNTTSDGLWAFDDEVGAPHQPSLVDDSKTYDVKIMNGGIVRWIKGAEKHQTASVVYFAVPFLDFVEQGAAPGAGLTGNSRVYVKTDHLVYIKDSSGAERAVGIDNFEGLSFEEQQLNGSGSVNAGVSTVWSLPAAPITIILPDPTITGYPVTVVNESPTLANTITLQTSPSTVVVGGSPNLTTGAIQNGVLNGSDSLTYQSDGANWRARG